MIKTATTIEGVNTINFGNTADRYYWCKNIGETTLYVSAKEDISPDTDDVAMLEPGDIVMIETYNQDIYVFGAGKIQIYESETNDCPFKLAAKGGEIPDLSVYAKTADVPNIKVNEAVNADTLDGLHADDFVNATDKGQIQIPDNVDVPSWIHANGKRYQEYMTNGDNIGLTNVPNDSIDWVWYWYDGVNIIAREWAIGRYYICDVINGGFSGWKDVYTSGYKPYVKGEEGCGNIVTATIKDYQIFNFTPSAVICQIADGSAFFADTIQNGFSITLTPQHNGKILKYIAFK